MKILATVIVFLLVMPVSYAMIGQVARKIRIRNKTGS